jgi:hypothetical protein
MPSSYPLSNKFTDYTPAPTSSKMFSDQADKIESHLNKLCEKNNDPSIVQRFGYQHINKTERDLALTSILTPSVKMRPEDFLYQQFKKKR